MKRVGFVLKVKEEQIDLYKKHHETVWPDMLDALRDAGWHNYSLFIKEDGTLFGYFETPHSLGEAVANMTGKEVNARWQTLMSPYFEFPDGAHADAMMLELEEVFHLD